MNGTGSDPSTLKLQGDLTLATVSDLFRELTSRLSGRERYSVIDLGATGRIDSAGLALLLEWQAMANVAGEPLQLSNVPNDVLRLARLCQASDLLGIETAAGDPARPGSSA